MKSSRQTLPNDDGENSFFNPRIDTTNDWTYFDSRAIQEQQSRPFSRPHRWQDLESETGTQEDSIDLFPNPELGAICAELGYTDTFEDSAFHFVRSQSSESTLEIGWRDSKHSEVGRTKQRHFPISENDKTAPVCPEATNYETSLDQTHYANSADDAGVAVECIALSSTQPVDDRLLEALEKDGTIDETDFFPNKSKQRFFQKEYCSTKCERAQMKRVLWSGVVTYDSIAEAEQEPPRTVELANSSSKYCYQAENSPTSQKIKNVVEKTLLRRTIGSHNETQEEEEIHRNQHSSQGGASSVAITTTTKQGEQITLVPKQRHGGDDGGSFFSIGEHIIFTLRSILSSYIPSADLNETTGKAEKWLSELEQEV